jgi:hypothetical protein
MKKVLWFSRHKMSIEQQSALGNCEITQFDGTMETLFTPSTFNVTSPNGQTTTQTVTIKDELKNFDIIAIVCPIALQKQFLDNANGKPVILAKNSRVLIPQADGTESKATFIFVKWEHLKEIKVVIEDFIM